MDVYVPLSIHFNIFLNIHKIGNGNRDHATSSKRGRSKRFSTKLSKAKLDILLNQALQAPSTFTIVYKLTLFKK